jgi:hypothetical protein
VVKITAISLLILNAYTAGQSSPAGNSGSSFSAQ